MSSSRTLKYKAEIDSNSIPPEVLSSKYHGITAATLPDIVWVERQGKWWPGKILGDRTKSPLKIRKFFLKNEIVRLGAPNKNNVQPFHCVQADEFIKQWKGCDKEKEFKTALSLAREATCKDEELPSVDDVLKTSTSNCTKKRSTKIQDEVVKSTYFTELSTLDDDDLPTVDSAIRLTSNNRDLKKNHDIDDFVSPTIKSKRVEQSQRIRILKGNREINKIDGLVKMPSLSELTDIDDGAKGKRNLTLWSSIRGPSSITKYSKPPPKLTQTKSIKKKPRDISSTSKSSATRHPSTNEDDDDFATFSPNRFDSSSKLATKSAKESLKSNSREGSTKKSSSLKNSDKVSTKSNSRKDKKKGSSSRSEISFDHKLLPSVEETEDLPSINSVLRRPKRDELTLLPSKDTNCEVYHSKRRTPAFSDSDSDSDSAPREKVVIKPRSIIKPRVIRQKKPSDELALTVNNSFENLHGKEAKKKKAREVASKSSKPSAYDSGLGSDISQQSPICEISFESQAILNENPDFDLDTSIMIPGELCLAYLKSSRSYFPGKVISYKRPDKYKTQFYDGQRRVLSRDDFFTIYEPEFLTCPLGDFTLEKEDPDYENPSLRSQVTSYEDELVKIMCGNDESSWRYDKFFRSLRERRVLAHYISRGPFGINDFHFISRVLKQMFMEQHDIEPELMGSEEINFMSVKVKHLCINPDLLNPKILQLFCDDVLLPEVIIRMIMTRENTGYREAEQAMLHGYIDSRWVEQVMAARHSFVDGRISLVEKNGSFVDEDE